MENPWKIVSVRDVSENRLDPWADLDKIAWSVDGHLAPLLHFSNSKSFARDIACCDPVSVRGIETPWLGGNIRQPKGTMGTGEGRQGER